MIKPVIRNRVPLPPELSIPTTTQYRLNAAERWWDNLTPEHRAYLLDAFNLHEDMIESVHRIYWLTRWRDEWTRL